MLVFSNCNRTDRLGRAFTHLLQISDAELSGASRELLNKLPLDKIRSFGPKELTNYIESLDEDRFQYFADTIAGLRQSVN